VDAAADGVDALEHLSRRAYDLLITDVHMPRMSGIDLVRAVRRQGNSIPLVVMDSYPDLFTESEVGAEAFAMLAKPFDLSEVRRVLQDAGTPTGREVTLCTCEPGLHCGRHS
jgi:CheY-like chemotaxis protein